MRQPHVWAIERAVEVEPSTSIRRMLGPWREVFSSAQESEARRKFAELEVAHMHDGRNLYDEMKLWHGEELLLHVWHNR